jgi:hypothetical protein
MPTAEPDGTNRSALRAIPLDYTVAPAGESAEQRARRDKILALISAAIAVVMSVLLYFHVRGINGPSYWYWMWLRLPAVRWYPSMLTAAAPIAVAAVFEGLGRRCRSSGLRGGLRCFALVLLVAAVAGMKITSIACVYPGNSHARIGAIVFNPSSTSYYTDAGAIASKMNGWSWLALYPQLLRTGMINLHTQSKPPGPLVYHMLFIHAMGYGRESAIRSGEVLALLGGLSILPVYWLIKVLARDATVAMTAAAMLALCPGFVLIYPSLDAAYVGPVALMLACWHLAVWRRGVGAVAAAIGCGVALALVLFFTYTPLVLGFFMAGDALLAWTAGRDDVRLAWRLAFRAALAAGAGIVVYVVAYLAIGFDPIDTFAAAWHNQHLLLKTYINDRPYPRTILFDLTDFAFSAAWVALIPAAVAMWRSTAAWRDKSTMQAGRMARLIALALAQPVLVAVTGLVQAETARVWNFMLPLLLLAAAIEVAGWRPWARGVFYGAMLLVLLVAGQNLQFMQPVPVFEQ